MNSNRYAESDKKLFTVIIPDQEKCRASILPWIRELASKKIPKGSHEESDFLQLGFISLEIIPIIREALDNMDPESRTAHRDYLKVAMGNHYPF